MVTNSSGIWSHLFASLVGIGAGAILADKKQSIDYQYRAGTVEMILRDEILIQVKLKSDDVDGVTLQEIAQTFLILLQILIVVLESSVRMGQWIGKLGIKPKKRRMNFWNRVAWLCCG